MAEDRRMTTDRFYGGVSDRLDNLRALLEYVENESPPQEELAEWVVSNTRATSTDAVSRHFAFLQSIDLINLSESSCELDEYGQLYLHERDPETLYEALSSGVKGFDTLLKELASGPMTDEDIKDLFVRKFDEAEMETPGPAARHREWLQSLGFVRRTDGVNELTEDGRRLLDSVEGTDDRLEREKEKVSQLRSNLLQSEMSCVPPGQQHLSDDVYPAVQSAYPDLCNDDFLCDEAHSSGRQHPEWKHAVRDIQQRIADREQGRIRRLDQRGMWLYRSQSASTDGSVGTEESDSQEMRQPDNSEPSLPEGSVTTERRENRISEIQRDRELVRELKDLYDDTCMVCGEKRLRGPDEGFSHVHHLMPLGEPHNGPDIPENVVVVCPNHHEDFEYGMLTIDPQTLTIEHMYEDDVTGQSLQTAEGHDIGAQYLAYHNQIIASN